MPQKVPISVPPVANDIVTRLTELLHKLTAGELPDIPPLADCLDALTNMNILYGLGLCVVGLVYLLRGWKVFKVLVALNAATIGAVIGALVTIQFGMQNEWWIGMLIGATFLGLLSWPLISIFIAVFGAIVGAMLGYSAFYQIVMQLRHGELVPFAWVSAIVGAILIAILTFIIFRQCVVMLTAAQGGTMLTAGTLCLLFKHPTLHEIITINLLEHPSLLFIIILSFTIIGLIVQFVNTNREKQAQKKAPTAP
jgi:hypothetical protein